MFFCRHPMSARTISPAAAASLKARGVCGNRRERPVIVRRVGRPAAPVFDEHQTAALLGQPVGHILPYLRAGSFFPGARQDPETKAWRVPQAAVLFFQQHPVPTKHYSIQDAAWAWGFTKTSAIERIRRLVALGVIPSVQILGRRMITLETVNNPPPDLAPEIKARLRARFSFFDDSNREAQA